MVYVHHILGIQASYARSYLFSIDPLQLTSSTCNYQLQSNTNTTFTIQTISFDSLSSSFAYGVKQTTWQPASGLLQEQLYMDFAPVVYTLLGFSKISFSGMALDLQTSLDVTSNMMSVEGSGHVAGL